MRFKLFGTPIVIRPMFWIVAVLLGAPGGTSPREIASLAIWVTVLLVSILVHELGHALAMRVFGSQPSIELWGLGGLTHWASGTLVSPAKSIVVSLAGPAAGFALGAMVFVGSSLAQPITNAFATDFVHKMLFVNIAWGVVNLVPILPLDGGHVAESLAGWIAGDVGRRGAHFLSLALSVVAIGVALFARQFWVAFLAAGCASTSYRSLVPPKPAESGSSGS